MFWGKKAFQNTVLLKERLEETFLLKQSQFGIVYHHIIYYIVIDFPLNTFLESYILNATMSDEIHSKPIPHSDSRMTSPVLCFYKHKFRTFYIIVVSTC